MILEWSLFTKGELPFDTQHRGDSAKPIEKFYSSGTKKAPQIEGLFDILKKEFFQQTCCDRSTCFVGKLGQAGLFVGGLVGMNHALFGCLVVG